MAKSNRKTLEHIEQFGCTVFHVGEEGELPPFSYSVGITKTAAAPEGVVVGLKQKLAHFMVNEYHLRVRAGERFQHGLRYAGFLEGFEVEARNVNHFFYDDYFGQCLRFYEDRSFDVIQLIYPNKQGIWPWQAEADDWFKSWQPILATAPISNKRPRK